MSSETPEQDLMEPAPCDPALLTLAFAAASEAGSDGSADGAAAAPGPGPTAGSGSAVQASATDDAALARALDAVADAVGGMAQAGPYMVRVWALGAMLARGELDAWAKSSGDDSVEVRDVVFEVAAVAPCRGGRFDPAEFVHLIHERLARPRGGAPSGDAPPAG